jgi:hypothetical protein
MATGHMLTNRGKLLLMQGIWDDAGASAIKLGFVQAQPVGVDTAVEVADLNTVTDLIVTAGATECNFTNYSAAPTRYTLTRTNAAEDDTNDRVNLDAADVVQASAGGASNNTIYGAFYYDATTDTNDTTRILIGIDWFATPLTTNGGTFTYAIADFIRAS